MRTLTAAAPCAAALALVGISRLEIHLEIDNRPAVKKRVGRLAPLRRTWALNFSKAN